jgi:hypothetical protein
MYNFIFYVMYNYNIERGRSTTSARHQATTLVTLEIFTNIMLILIICKRFYNTIGEGLGFLNEYKILMFALMIGTGLLVFKYYSPDRIEANAGSTRYSNISIHKFLMFILIVFPIIVILLLSQKSLI